MLFSIKYSKIAIEKRRGKEKMQKFFVEESQIQENQVVIQGSDVNHIKNVLRMKPGMKGRINETFWARWKSQPG